MKRFKTIIFAVFFALSLTACGNKNGGASGGENLNSNNRNNPYSSAKAGDIIQFGGLDWVVLNVQDGKALILTDSVIENRAYHSKQTDITWENCDLRQYLNGAFYDNTFSPEEKKLIIETTVVNSDNPEYGTPGGNGTTDKVFLLSIDEVDEYMGDNVHVNIKNKRIAKHLVTEQASWWWLRSPGGDGDGAASVLGGGHVGVIGFIVVNVENGVRPALLLNLQS